MKPSGCNCSADASCVHDVPTLTLPRALVCPNAGVIIPLLAELDPANASQLFMNWDMARCLKWRYADKISLRRVYPTELSVAANNVDVPADASVIAGTIVAATQVGCSCMLDC